MGARLIYASAEFCACPECGGDLASETNGLRCAACRVVYAVEDGIPVLLPDYKTEVQKRYLENYDAMARHDLEAPLEVLRDARHTSFLKFVGNQKGRRLLDIGSSHGLYLDRTHADFKVALDLAMPYLRAISAAPDTFRMQGDAEYLPVRNGFFDTVLVSDVLEHLMDPANFVNRLRTICRRDTVVYVHIPWEENLESYNSSGYEFTHLRRFEAFSFAELFKDFDIERVKAATPDLEEPLLFRLQSRLPRSIYNRLAADYFERPGKAEKDLAWRRSLMSALPRGEWWLLRLYRPKFKMFRLRIRAAALARRGDETQTVLKHPESDRARILMLVPHEPDLDPRIKWTSDLCAEIHPTHVLGVTSSTDKQQREFHDRAFIERVNIAEIASSRAQARVQRLAELATVKPALEYLAHGGGRPRRLSPRAWLRQNIAAVERFVAAVAFYRLLGHTLWRRARSLSMPPTVVVCHDIYALGAALKIKARWGSMVLYDSHEFWPEADLMAKSWEKVLTKAYERSLIRRADAVVTVSPPLAQHLERTYGLKNVISVPNACPRELGVVSSAEHPIELPVRVLVQGRVAPRRGFEELLSAWRELDGVPAVLDIRCLHNAYMEDLKATYRDLVDSGQVRFLPAVPESKLVQAAAQSDVGIIPYTGISLNHVFACPNKLAQYMHAGLAIVSNDLPFVRSVVQEYRCGLIYQAEQPRTFVRAIETIAGDLDLLQRMKQASTRAAALTFNWEVQSQAYREEVMRLAAASPVA